VKRLVVPSFAKINLGLEVLGLREDGYHELRTLFQTIDLHDTVTLGVAKEGIEVECDLPGLPTGEDNLAFRAARDLLAFAGCPLGVRIRIAKRIPVGGGLGGGSSNAASVLLGMNRLFGLGLRPFELHPLASRLGADVPFFLIGGTALGLGRGDECYPLARQVRGHLVLVDPGRGCSTAAVFGRIDKSLTQRENSHSIYRFISRDLEGDDAFRILSNDLEPASFEEAPELGRNAREIRGVLELEGASLAALSGSGSAFFGFFKDARQARRAGASLHSAGHRILRARTLTLAQYRKRWGGSFFS
jgi:4-diphosphocytidyl-2-C-methyl-D-erythritol kinase